MLLLVEALVKFEELRESTLRVGFEICGQV